MPVAPQFYWRDASREDRPLLQGFTCTAELPRDRNGRPLPHPKPWEHDVQSWIRSRTPPAGPGEALRLETDEESLRAFGALAMVDQEGEMVIVKLQAVAISTECRGGGGEVADGAIEEALARAVELTAKAGGTTTLLVAWVDPRNDASKRLMERAGFAIHGLIPGNPPLEQWTLQVVPAGERERHERPGSRPR